MITHEHLQECKQTVSNEYRKDYILKRLPQIDMESIRALRAKMLNRGQPTDDTKLSTLEDEAAALRTELAGLQ